MTKLCIYLHGKGGNASEAEHYKPLFPDTAVMGFDYQSETPWDAVQEFQDYFDAVSADYSHISVISNSIGAFFTLCSLGDRRIDRAYFISPIVNMEKLITSMMQWANVTEQELREKKEIHAPFGETLSWDYLTWVRYHPPEWRIPTEILYGGCDNLQSLDTVQSFAEQTGANITVMEHGEHWFHTPEQVQFLDTWIRRKQ